MVAECTHCGDLLSQARLTSLKDGDVPYCCSGCQTVHQILLDGGLDRRFYSIQGKNRGPSLKNIPTRDFSALDFEDAIQMDFFIEGIHCTACLWVLEKLSDLSPEVKGSRLDMGRSILRVVRHEPGGFSKISQLLFDLGYPPHAIRSESESAERLVAQDQLTLKRIGISAFSAMNIMVYSFSLYLGVEGTLATVFRSLSLLVALPALTYGAWPFYRNAFFALKSKRISMDLPISLALIVGFFESCRQAFLGSNLLYLDSITMLVTLLLLSRYFLARLERAETSKAGVLHAILPEAVRDSERHLIRIDRVKVGDHLLLRVGDTIPADGILISGNVAVNEAFLTGESQTISKGMLSSVLAGSQVLEGEALLKVEALQENTRLGQLSRQVDHADSVTTIRSEKSDRWATIFMGSVMGFSILMLALFGRDDLGEAMKRSLALLIIACPCALALATPLALARGYRVAARSGILLRDPQILNQCVQMHARVFDKTGTLTQGKPEVQSVQWFLENPAMLVGYQSLIYSLELQSKHPYAGSIVQFLENIVGVQEVPLEAVEEKVGRGMEANRGGHRYFIGRKDAEFSGVGFWEDQTLLAQFRLSDQVRTGAQEVIESLKNDQGEIYVFSGDDAEIVQNISQALGIKNFEGELLPEEKASRIRDLKKSGGGKSSVLMLGDGINDLPALAEADIGIAFNRSMGGTLDAALVRVPVIFLKPKLSLLLDFEAIIKQFHFTMKRNLWISFFYNLTGASLAVSGVIHPLVAAIAMPLSSMTVFISTVFGIRGRNV